MGMLMTICARTHGAQILRKRMIEPMSRGEPPFVLSDAFPGDLLPIPAWLRLAEWSDAADRKRLKRARWLATADFRMASRGEAPAPEAFISDEQVFFEDTRQHNTLDRLSDTSSESGLGLGIFNRPETCLRSIDAEAQYLSIYLRVFDEQIEGFVLDLIRDLATSGFGADTATGRGQFDFVEEADLMADLDSAGYPNSVIALSTFQPGSHDPADGLWEAFPKFGKLGPDHGLADVRKNTLILFRPGACFLSDRRPPFLGRAVPMRELLPIETAYALLQKGVEVIHPAFALTVPAVFDRELLS